LTIKEKFLATRAKLKVARVELTDDLTALVEGETLYVREMNAAESGDYETSGSVQEVGDDGKVAVTVDMSKDRQQLVVRTLCDADGGRVFADDDIPAVSLVPRQLMDAVYEAAVAVNGIKNRAERKKALEKNSTAAAAASPSA
jgi:hypothetical protein